MKNIISYIIGVIILLQLISHSAIAQNLPKGEVNITINQFEQKERLLYIKFHLDISNIKIKSRQALIYTPIISATTKSINLPEILVRGRDNYKSDIRRIALISKKERVNYTTTTTTTTYATIKAFGKNIKSINYEYVIPYEDWMMDSKLEIKREISSCGNIIKIGSETLADITLEPILIIEEVVPAVPIVLEDSPEDLSVTHISQHEGDLKVLDSQKDEDIFKVYFPINVSTIDKNYVDNTEVLTRLTDVITQIQASNDFSIAKLFIVGFASIEGSYQENEILSYRRTKSVDDYLSSNTNVNESLIEVHIGAENWNDLYNIVLNSDMADKAEILYIIDNTPNYEARTRMLMNLNGGDTYRYMNEILFPRLRYVYIKVYIDNKLQL